MNLQRKFLSLSPNGSFARNGQEKNQCQTHTFDNKGSSGVDFIVFSFYLECISVESTLGSIRTAKKTQVATAASTINSLSKPQ